jgi:hypothetical protein
MGKITKPHPTDYPPFYETYIKLVSDNTIKNVFAQSFEDFKQFIDKIPESKANFKYELNKWSTKQVLQHIIDTERIFNFRALCFARGENQSIPGFDENEYAFLADVDKRNLNELKEELIVVRNSTILLFESFNIEMLQRKGKANNAEISVNAIGFCILGHSLHHFNILKERYL